MNQDGRGPGEFKRTLRVDGVGDEGVEPSGERTDAKLRFAGRDGRFAETGGAVKQENLLRGEGGVDLNLNGDRLARREDGQRLFVALRSWLGDLHDRLVHDEALPHAGHLLPGQPARCGFVGGATRSGSNSGRAAFPARRAGEPDVRGVVTAELHGAARGRGGCGEALADDFVEERPEQVVRLAPFVATAPLHSDGPARFKFRAALGQQGFELRQLLAVL